MIMLALFVKLEKSKFYFVETATSLKKTTITVPSIVTEESVALV